MVVFLRRFAVFSSWQPLQRHFRRPYQQPLTSTVWCLLLLIAASVASAFVPSFANTRHYRSFLPHPPLTHNTASPLLSISSPSTTAVMGIKGFRAWFESQFPNAIVTMPDKSKVSESFDHVLMDMNQFLHICLRKSRSDGHALTLLMKELDAACTMARPLKTLVLAMDGPPSAAKLATQRQRRFGTLVRCQARFQHIHTFSARFSLRERTRRKRRYVTETKTLCITPGTDFMRLAEQAILYWAWQRLANPRHFLTDVEIYISTSLVPGEGEVKLLDWIVQYQSKAILRHENNWNVMRSPNKSSTPSHHHYHHRPKSSSNTSSSSSTPSTNTCPLMEESYAILGGDSDLVLEGLVIQATNVFVLLPDGKQRYLSVSLWETTRTLHSIMEKSNASGGRHKNAALPAPPLEGTGNASTTAPTTTSETVSPSVADTSPLHPWQESLLRIRTDLVLLLILNGNDYLPRIRGSSGFNKLFHTYFRLLRQWKTNVAASPTSSNASKQPATNQTGTGTSGRRRRSGKQKQQAQQQQKQLQQPSQQDGEPFLVNPITLEFNLPFCIAFFRQLVQMAPPAHLMSKTQEERAAEVAKGRQRTALSQLHNLVDGGFLPQPIQWKVVRPGEEDDDNDNKSVEASKLEAEMNNDRGEDNEDGPSKINGVNGDKPIDAELEAQDESDDDEEGEQILVRLILGEEGTEDCCTYEAWHTLGSPLKNAKHEIARIALEDQLGSEFSNLMDENEDDENFGMTTSGYAWEISHAMPGKVNTYLAGLLWNLQTYQDGVCSDYAFNYGKRLAPTANEIVNFLESASKENRKVGRRELIGDKFEPSISAGLASLAALPSQVKDLVPLPYRNLSAEVIEEIYGACMDPEDNAFDIRKFEQLANERVGMLVQRDGEKESGLPSLIADQLHEEGFKEDSSSTPFGGNSKFNNQQSITYEDDLTTEVVEPSLSTNGADSTVNGADSTAKPDTNNANVLSRKIITGDNYWTVLARSKAALSSPFEPPAPFSDRLAMLWPSNRMRVSRSMATWGPREINNLGPDDTQSQSNKPKAGGRPEKLEAAKRWSQKLKEYDSIMDVPYKKAYVRESKGHKRDMPKDIVKDQIPVVKVEKPPIVLEMKKKRNKRDVDVAKRMKDFKFQMPPKDPATTVDGFTALASLKQLEDSGMIGATEWKLTMPSTSKYASFNPKEHEWIELTIPPASDSSKSIIPQTVTFGQDRDANAVSKQMLKQHLASLALQNFTGPERQWFEFTFKDLKNYLGVNSKIKKN